MKILERIKGKPNLERLQAKAIKAQTAFEVAEGNTPPEPNTLVMDLAKGFQLEYIEKPTGRQWRYDNNLVYWMSRDTGGTMTPVAPPKGMGGKDITPDELYWALYCREAEILFALPASMWEKAKTVALYVLIGALLFFMFIIGSS